jgi:FeS assembly SUF system protein
MTSSPIDKITTDMLESQVVEVLRTVYDPEIPVNIYDLGLVYGVDVKPTGDVHIRMTLTSPACPVAESLPPEVKSRVEVIPAVNQAEVEIVWDPPWSPEKMSEAAKLNSASVDTCLRGTAWRRTIWTSARRRVAQP